jgi:hypothetical protein
VVWPSQTPYSLGPLQFSRVKFSFANHERKPPYGLWTSSIADGRTCEVVGQDRLAPPVSKRFVRSRSFYTSALSLHLPHRATNNEQRTTSPFPTTHHRVWCCFVPLPPVVVPPFVIHRGLTHLVEKPAAMPGTAYWFVPVDATTLTSKNHAREKT